jgi:hypothetical protein
MNHVFITAQTILEPGVLSYSRARGLIAGVSLESTSLRPDDEATEQVYGRKMTAGSIVTGSRTTVPESGRHLIDVLEKGALQRIEEDGDPSSWIGRCVNRLDLPPDHAYAITIKIAL